jgi:hypothetical protein
MANSAFAEVILTLAESNPNSNPNPNPNPNPKQAILTLAETRPHLLFEG